MSDAGTAAEIQRRAAEIVKAYPLWYHSIELAPGVITPGVAPLEVWKGTLRKLGLPDLRRKSVLDIGAYDGFFSFASSGSARPASSPWTGTFGRPIRRVADFLAPGGFLGIETEAVDVPGAPDAAFFEFFPGNELNNDAANWWAPNMKALESLTRAAGLRNFTVGAGPPPLSRWARLRAKIRQDRKRFRAVASARAPA